MAYKWHSACFCTPPSVESPKTYPRTDDVTLSCPPGGTELGHPAKRRDDNSDLSGLGSHAGSGVAGRGRRRRQPGDAARGHGHDGSQQVTIPSPALMTLIYAKTLRFHYIVISSFTRLDETRLYADDSRGPLGATTVLSQRESRRVVSLLPLAGI